MNVTAEEQPAIRSQASESSAALWLERVRLRAQRRTGWLRTASEAGHAQPADRLVIFQSEVDRALQDQTEVLEFERLFHERDPDSLELLEQIEMVDVAFREDPVRERLRYCFSLSDLEFDLLNLAVAVEIDPLLRRVYAYLHDEAGSTSATQWLTRQLFGHSRYQALDPDSPLVRWHIAKPAAHAANAWSSDTPWLADPGIVLLLLGRGAIDPALGDSVQVYADGEDVSGLCLYPDELRDMREFTRVMSEKARIEASKLALDIELIGVDGCGKRTLAAQFTASIFAALLCADAETLLGAEIEPNLVTERLTRVLRMARLTGSIPYWTHADKVPARVWRVADRNYGVMVFGGLAAGQSRGELHGIRRLFHLPLLKREQRIELWRMYSSHPPPQPIQDGLLTPAEIVEAAELVPAGTDIAIAACQENLRVTEQQLFTPLPCPYSWDDIVLPQNVREHLRELEQQVHLRWQVYEEWGFERLCPVGRGITALFSGASGTGKTMAAQVLARSLGLKLLRVDLASVVNKYIGETEKKLKQVFDACERANVLLLFDEADALFGQRTQVKDAHDRFANIEIDYLLQRMEQFDGVAVLSTNRKGDLDKAFLRRIRFIVDFQQPGPAERLALWRRALPQQSPSGEELLSVIDWDLLSRKLPMTGAGITSAALGAAFLARADGGRIDMSHVLHAARREMNKQGQNVRPGEWDS